MTRNSRSVDVRRLRQALALGLTVLVSAPASGQNPKKHVQELIGEKPMAADDTGWPWPAAPDGNPFPHDWEDPAAVAYRDAKVKLGKLLFWDEQVSVDNTMSCGTCHFPSAGGVDARAAGTNPVTNNHGSFGVHAQSLEGSDVIYGSPAGTGPDPLVTERAAPTVIGAYVFNRLFWDRSAQGVFRTEDGKVLPGFEDYATLESVSVNPPITETELGLHDIAWSDGFIQAKLNAARPLALVDPATVPPDIAPLVEQGHSYKRLFDQVFSVDPQLALSKPVGVTRERFAMSIAHYLRTLVPDEAPIDTVGLQGDALEGFKTVNQNGCFTCHSTATSPPFSIMDTLDLTANNRIKGAFNQPLSDGGSGKVTVTSVKVPTLRNVALRPRFFHTGKLPGHPTTIDGLLDFYDDLQSFSIQNLIPGGTLSDTQRTQVTAFLHSLTDPRVANESPPFDRPELASERLGLFGTPKANQFGEGIASTPEGEPPFLISNAPAHLPLGSELSHFRMGLGGTEPGSLATFALSRGAGAGPEAWIGPIGATWSTATDANGLATFTFALPPSPGLVGATFYVQAQVEEAQGTARSAAAGFEVFRF